MQTASPQSVRGDFNDATFAMDGVTSKFTQRDGRYLVTTDGADGALHEYEIKYTFGVVPLQQYLVDMGSGRLQALGIAWDTRAKDAGGQRWFHLYPEQKLKGGHPLHWTGIDQNWNHMCAECHSTNLRKNFRADRDLFETSWSEINVACEACHGPGSLHVAWAHVTPAATAKADDPMGLSVRFGDRRAAVWAMDPVRGIARRSGPAPRQDEVETCGLCHARRGMEKPGHIPGRPLADTHRIAVLEDGLYHADGQIRDEVYEYGSFRQSRMYQAGVTCSDCHEPHSGRLRAQGNALCLSCHDAQHFDGTTHHFHPPDSAGAQCVACHMPAKTYMQIDDRRDHSFRVPRPDLSRQLESPNPCNACHADHDAAWAAATLQRWYGSKERPPHYGEAIHAARAALPNAGAGLARWIEDSEAASIVRATAIHELAHTPADGALALLQRVAGDGDAQVRRAVAETAEGLDVAQRVPMLTPLLRDPVHGVRLAAGRALASVPPAALGAAATARDAALREFRSTQLDNADRPESHLNLGNLEAELGDVVAAERAYRTALQRDASFVPAYVNLADLLRASGRDDEVESLLRAGIAQEPGAATLHHSLGLLYVRQKSLTAALGPLRHASELAPHAARFSYVYAVALDSAGQPREALQIVDAALLRAPADPYLKQLRVQLQGGGR